MRDPSSQIAACSNLSFNVFLEEVLVLQDKVAQHLFCCGRGSGLG
mgnify:CR=1 FL=1